MANPQTNKGFSTYSDPGLQDKAQLIVSSTTDNANFPAPHPELDAAAAASTAYSAALLTAKSGDKTDIVIKNQKRDDLIDCLRNLGFYVDLTAKGNISILSSSGFDISKDPSGSPDLVKPEIIVLKDGLNSGSFNIRIKKVPGAKSYIYQYTITDPTLDSTQWTSQMCTVTKLELKNLESGKRYWCRVAAIGSKEQVAYGDPVSRIAQ